MPFDSLSPSLHPLGHLWRLWLVLVTYVTYTCPYVVAQDDNGTAVSTVAPNLLLEEPLCGYSKRDLAFKAVESYTANALLLSTNQYEDNFYDDKSIPDIIFSNQNPTFFSQSQITTIIPELLTFVFGIYSQPIVFKVCFFDSPRLKPGTDSNSNSSHLTLMCVLRVWFL